MRNLLAFFAAAIVAFAWVGWYLDWYKIKADPAVAGHRNVNIDFDSDKIVSDSQKGMHKVEEKLQKVLDKKNSDEKANSGDVKQSQPGSLPSLSPPRLTIQQEQESSESSGPALP